MTISEFLVLDYLIAILIILVAILAFLAKKIDLKGAISGAFMAFVIWYGTHLLGLVSLFLFFVFGSIVSSWKKETKSRMHLTQDNDGKRGLANVMANGGIAFLLSIVAISFPDSQDLLTFMTLSSFATACSDTFSSELGNIYGKKYFNIIDLKIAERGVDGAISYEGLLFGLIGSLLIAIGAFAIQVDLGMMLAVTAIGLLGNLIDSVLGATLQKRGYLNNHQVNFFATLGGALLALFYYIF